jgi:hypothetical protein
MNPGGTRPRYGGAVPPDAFRTGRSAVGALPALRVNRPAAWRDRRSVLPSRGRQPLDGGGVRGAVRRPLGRGTGANSRSPDAIAAEPANPGTVLPGRSEGALLQAREVGSSHFVVSGNAPHAHTAAPPDLARSRALCARIPLT